MRGNYLRNMRQLLLLLLLFTRCKQTNDIAPTTKAIRDAFAASDVTTIVKYHHPDIIKYFGGTRIVTGREALTKGLTDMFRNTKLEFVENTVESTLYNGNTVIETSIFRFRSTPKNGGPVTYSKGRSMVVYVRSSDSPTGWVSIREMAQEAPAD